MTATARLALDCAAEGLSLALEVTDKNKQIHVFETERTGARTSDLLPAALQSLLQQACLTPANLIEVHLTVGPGSFTGIRLGLATAEALRLLNPAITLHAYSSLHAHAYQLLPQANSFTLALDAAGQQIYTQTFSPNGEPQTEPVCIPVTELEITSATYAQASLLLAAQPLPALSAARLFFMPETARISATPLYLKPLTYKKVSE